MAAGAAGAPETLGVSLAVAAATAAYIKWHKQINHFVSSTAHHIWNGAKDVAKWGARTAKDVAGHVVNAGKAVAKFGGAVVGAAARGIHHLATGAAHLASSVLSSVGGFFGGLFGGGGGSKPKPDHPMYHLAKLSQMTFAGGSLNVNVAGNKPYTGKSAFVGPMGAVGAGAIREVHIHPGAFVVNVHGSMDHATMTQVRQHVGQQFAELERNLKSSGRR